MGRISAIGIAAVLLTLPCLAGEQPAEPITVKFNLPKDAFVTIAIDDARGPAAGIRVRNLIAEQPMKAGENTVAWDGLQENGALASPGTYRWRGLYRDKLGLEYQFSVYDAGAIPPWFSPGVNVATDTGWLSDHNPPWSVCAAGDKMFIGALTSENGQSLMATDLDGRKLWGISHIAAAGASDFAYDGMMVYVGGEGQWAGANAYFFQIDPNTFELTQIYHNKAFVGIRGMAARDGKLYISSAVQEKILVLDIAKKEIVSEIPLKKAQGIAFTPDGTLLAITDRTVVVVSADGNHRTLINDHLAAPNRLAVAKDGTICITDGPKSWYHDTSTEATVQYDVEPRRFEGDNQIKVFGADGEFIRAIGKRRVPGKFDPQSIRCPIGVAVDARGRIWTCEWDMLPKRISVWTPDGKLVKEFIGSHKYGGSGSLDPGDKSQMIYDGMLFRLDWAKGTWKLESTIVDIMTAECEAKHVPGGYPNWPTKIVRYEGRGARRAPGGEQYFVGGSYYGSGATIWKRNGDSFTAVAMVTGYQPGSAADLNEGKIDTNDYLYQRMIECVGDKAPGDNNKWGCCGKKGKWCGHISYLMIWADANGDGAIQPKEVVMHDGPSYWIAPPTVGPDMTIYLRQPPFRGETNIWRMPLAGINEHGAPLYDPKTIEPVAMKLSDNSTNSDLVADAAGGLYLNATPIYGIDPKTKRTWSYSSGWSGLGNGAPRWRPGLVIAGWGMRGAVDAGGEIGTLVAVNSNFGQWYLFTGDGLFLATVFGDCRTSPYWGTRFKDAKRGMDVNGASLGQESFGGSLNRTPDGEIAIVAGHPHCGIVTLKGLDTVKRIGGDVAVTVPQLLASARALEKQAIAERAEKGIPETTMWAQKTMLNSIPKYHGQYSIALKRPGMLPVPVWVSFDRQNLVLRAAMPHFANKGTDQKRLFASGDAIIAELGLDPAADANRTEPQTGDVRIVVSMLDGKPVAVVHDIRKTSLVQKADVTVEPFESETGGGVCVTATIPWREIVAKPPKFALDMVIPGDVGVVLAKPDGSGVADRIMWANPVPVVLGDLSRLTPHLWGRFKIDPIGAAPDAPGIDEE